MRENMAQNNVEVAVRVRARGSTPDGTAGPEIRVATFGSRPANWASRDPAAVEGDGIVCVGLPHKRANLVAHGAAPAIEPDLGQVAKLGPELRDLRQRERRVLVLGHRGLTREPGRIVLLLVVVVVMVVFVGSIKTRISLGRSDPERAQDRPAGPTSRTDQQVRSPRRQPGQGQRAMQLGCFFGVLRRAL